MKILTLLILSLLAVSAFAKPESTATFDLSGSSQSQPAKNEIVLNNDNCKMDSAVNLSINGAHQDFINSLGAQVLIICNPQGQLRQIVDNHDLLGTSGAYKVTTTDLNIGAIDHHVDGKKNLAIYLTEAPKNIRFFLARGEITLEYGGVKSPCWQEIGMMCPEGQVDVCHIDRNAELHMCVIDTSTDEAEFEAVQ